MRLVPEAQYSHPRQVSAPHCSLFATVKEAIQSLVELFMALVKVDHLITYLRRIIIVFISTCLKLMVSFHISSYIGEFTLCESNQSKSVIVFEF